MRTVGEIVRQARIEREYSTYSPEFTKYLSQYSNQKIQKTIVDIRKHLGLSTTQLAHKVKMDIIRLEKIEEGKSNPYTNSTIRILKALDELYVFIIVNKNEIKPLNEVIATARKNKGYTIIKLSELSKISIMQFYAIERGQIIRPHNNTIEKLEKYLEIDLSYSIL